MVKEQCRIPKKIKCIIQVRILNMYTADSSYFTGSSVVVTRYSKDCSLDLL